MVRNSKDIKEGRRSVALRDVINVGIGVFITQVHMTDLGISRNLFDTFHERETTPAKDTSILVKVLDDTNIHLVVVRNVGL